jgi:HlyD family secretion protein
MAEMGKHWHEGRLAYYRAQLDKCKIYAPQRGMVAYHVDANRWGHSSTIAAGQTLWRGQPVMSIPDLTRMQVRTAVHETVVDRVRAGMRATVRLDAFPNRTYAATVHAVDVLPDPGGWFSSDTKTYQTIVTIDEEVDRIKPGMTAVVEIHITQLPDVLCIPIESIVQQGAETWCYLLKNGRPRKCVLELGSMNDRFVEIRSGLSADDRVVLNPSLVLP